MKEPKIRFKGFEGKWEESTIGKVTSVNRGVRVTRKNLSDHGLYPVYQNTDYPMGYYNRYNVESNNPFVIIGGSAGLIGFCDKDFWAADDCAYFSDSVKIDKFYLYCMLLNKSSEIKKNVRGSSVPRLDRQVINDLNISLPSIKEQQSIASYFQHLDSLIQSTTKKIESLKQVKAASLQSMFPQEGETTPRVRFKGFEGEWKKVKFGEIAIISRGLTYAPFNLRDKGVRVLRSSNINEDVFVISENDVFVNEECINIEYAEEGNILVTAANGSPRLVGKHAIINNIGTNTTVVGGFMLLISSNESAFLNASMSSSWYSKFLKVGVAGGNGAIGNLSKQELEDTELLIPNKKDERNYIASYFTNLDRQITLHTQRLEKLKQIKSACLDNMFV